MGEAVVHMDGTEEEEEKKESEYELPQDAFAKLTQSIDDIANEVNDETMIELDMKPIEPKAENTEDLDKWLNADDDDWFDRQNSSKMDVDTLDVVTDDKVENNESAIKTETD